MNLVNASSVSANESESALAQSLYGLIAQRGLVGSKRLQALTGKSQATIARALASLGSRVIQLGKARRTLYAVPKSILDFSGEQTLTTVDATGVAHAWGRLCYLEGQHVYVEATHAAMRGWSSVSVGALPWFLEPLRLQGFLGKLRGAALGFVDHNPEHWSLEQMLFAVLAHEHDNVGAFSLGEVSSGQADVSPTLAPIDAAARGEYYDSVSGDLAKLISAGSSAGGEQPKFLAHIKSQATADESLVVKFTPPRGTPFGERWHDLLHAEAMALYVLSQHGIAVAQPRIIESERRTYLESVRFDRVSLASNSSTASKLGKRHVVALASVHDAFVGGTRQHWVASCVALHNQKRLSEQDLFVVQTVFEFGRLIGNTDMHFGNLSLYVDDMTRMDDPSFILAPIYDMLPMLYRPSEFRDELGYAPFALPVPLIGSLDARSKAEAIALDFWQAMTEHTATSKGFRALATQMLLRHKTE